MLFTPSNREDISKYFRNSFLKFKETGDTLYYLDHVDANKVSGAVDNGQPFHLYLDDEHPYEVDYVLPHKSFFQVGPNAVMLQRIPAKQYSRGLTEANTGLTYLAGKEPMKALLSFEILKQFVKKQQFYSLAQATTQEGLQSAVLSPRMMYNRADRNIYIDFLAVAKVSATRNITMMQPIFEEEVLDLLKSTGESILFKVQP